MGDKWTKADWDDLIDLCDAALQNPPGDTICSAGANLQFLHQESPIPWRKTAIEYIRSSLLSAARQGASENDCGISFTELGDRWEAYIIDELVAAKDLIWCDCPDRPEVGDCYDTSVSASVDNLRQAEPWPTPPGNPFDYPWFFVTFTDRSSCDYRGRWWKEKMKYEFRDNIAGTQLYPLPVAQGYYRFWYMVEIVDPMQLSGWCTVLPGRTMAVGRGNVHPDGTIPSYVYNSTVTGYYRHYRGWVGGYQIDNHWEYGTANVSWKLVGLCMSYQELIDGGWWDGFGQPQAPWIDFSDYE